MRPGTLYRSTQLSINSVNPWSAHQASRGTPCKLLSYVRQLAWWPEAVGRASSDQVPLTAPSSSSSPGAVRCGRLKLIKALLVLLFVSLAVITYQSAVYHLLSSSYSATSSLFSLCEPYFAPAHHRRRHPANFNISLTEALQHTLRDEADSPVVLVSTDLTSQESGSSSREDYRSPKCSHYSCFDIYRCGVGRYKSFELHKHASTHRRHQERIKVYVYPRYQYQALSGESLPTPMSAEFTRILQAILHSRYYTPNPRRACLFVVNLDLLNVDAVNLNQVEQILWSMPHFARLSGANHLLFTLLFNGTAGESHYGIDIGSAMVAGAGYKLSLYRDQFDVALPGYSLLAQLYEDSRLQLVHFDIDAIARLPRQWTLVSTQANSVSSETRYLLKRLQSIYSNQMLLLHFDCPTLADYTSQPRVRRLLEHAPRNSTASKMYHALKVCNGPRKIYSRYLDMLHSSQFCLILRTRTLSSPLLSDALMSGCIPVILADNLVLPFEQRIDWSSAAIRIWEHSTNELIDILNGISPRRREQMRINGLHIWRQYFASLETVAVTTLDIINERVYPAPRNVFAPVGSQLHELKPQSLAFYSHGYNYITAKETNLRAIGFTAVILSYNRLESLFEVILSVARAPSCAKIIVVWNNVLIRPPPSDHWPSVPMPIQVVLAPANKLSNRFFPYASIETEAIFAIDDDIGMLNADEIEFAFQTWRQFPERIVGFPSRLHHWDNYSRSWQYDSEWKNQISLILTGAAFYHSYYNHLYTHVMPASIRDWVDRHMNCEDIAMNFLVSNITCAAPIKVTPRKKFKCPECSRPSPKLSADAVQHLQMRSKCIDYFASIYQMMPLKPVEFRANPVLFRDNIPDKLKHFNLIGQL